MSIRRNNILIKHIIAYTVYYRFSKIHNNSLKILKSVRCCSYRLYNSRDKIVRTELEDGKWSWRTLLEIIRVRVLFNSARKVCGRLRIPQEGERERRESARALYKRHTRERIPATRRYSFEKRPPVDKSANLTSLLWRYASRDVTSI